jgi:hypothetical protein
MQGDVTKAMELLWDNVLTGPVYAVMANLGALLAAITLTISLVQLTKELLSPEDTVVPYEKFIWWAMVILLLMDNGSNLSRLTLSFRDLVRSTNNMVLSQQVGDKTLEEHWSKSTRNVAMGVAFENAMDNCLSLPEPEDRVACEESVQQQVEAEGNEGWWSGIGRALSSVIERAFIAVMLAISVAFQWLVEVTLILTALLGPLAVGATLLPVAQKSLYTWLIAFYCVGLCQLCYNLLVALLASLQSEVPSANRLIFTVSIGLLSPVLAVVMAAGGGMATFSSLAGLAGMVGGKLGGKTVGLAGKGLKTGGIKTGQLIGRSSVKVFNSAKSAFSRRRWQ